MNTEQIVVGITVDTNGQAHISGSVKDALFDLSLHLEESTNMPVDMEHVVGALVMARRQGQLGPEKILSTTDEHLTGVLAPHVLSIFKTLDGRLGNEDEA